MVRLNVLLRDRADRQRLYLVKISYESRRLFAEIENAHGTERQLESDRRRLEAERQAQATHLRVESTRAHQAGHARRHAGQHAVRGRCRPRGGAASAPLTMPSAPASAVRFGSLAMNRPNKRSPQQPSRAAR